MDLLLIKSPTPVLDAQVREHLSELFANEEDITPRVVNASLRIILIKFQREL